MNTTKRPTLDSDRIDTATKTIRAYKHRFRYAIICKLLLHGRLSSGEIASYLNLDEDYILEHLSVLHDSGLVISEESERGIFFSANEKKLLHLKKSVRSFVDSSGQI